MILRDRWGIAHVRADSVERLAFEQGWACARERGDQLLLEHHRGLGTTTSVVGDAGAEWDEFADRTRLAELARRAFDVLPDADRAFVSAYADGVRAAKTVPGWQDWSSLVVFAVQHILFAGFPGKLWRRHALATLGPAAADFTLEGQPHGSNAFVVGAARTRHGLGLVAGDPHRLFERPGVYQQVRLAAEDFDVAGFTFPGVPGVQHFAHAGTVAWGITNAVADYQDLADSAEDLRLIDEPAISLRTPAWLAGDLGFAALLPLLRARSADDVVAAFWHWVEPVNNLLVADTAGTVRHVVVGRVPERDEAGNWTGLIDLPSREASADGVFVSANDRAWPDFARIGNDFSPPFRADRIRTLIEDEPRMDAGSAARVLTDVHQTAGASLLEAIAGLDRLSEAARALQRELADWDREMTPGSITAAAFKRVRDAVVAAIAASPALDGVRRRPAWADFYAPWFDLALRVQDSLHHLIARPHIFGLDRDAILRAAVEDVAAAPPTTWAELHRFAALSGDEQFGLDGHAPQPEAAIPLPGDAQCVFATGSLPGTAHSHRGPVARYAWDLAGWEHSGWVTPLDEQHALWARGDFVPLVRDWDQLQPEPEPAPEEMP